MQGAPIYQKALRDYSAGQARAQKIVITSAMRELPDCSQQIEELEQTVAGLLELEEQE